MTTIDIWEDKVHVFGHANYAPEGYDIVCCAISTLTESLYRYLKATKNKVEATEDDGEYTIDLIELNETGYHLINEYSKIISEIIEEYPMYVRRKEHETIREVS